MRNNKGKSMQDRIVEEIQYAKNIADQDKRKLLAAKVLGAVDIAIEFNLISFNEWETYITEIFSL